MLLSISTGPSPTPTPPHPTPPQNQNQSQRHPPCQQASPSPARASHPPGPTPPAAVRTPDPPACSVQPAVAARYRREVRGRRHCRWLLGCRRGRLGRGADWPARRS